MVDFRLSRMEPDEANLKPSCGIYRQSVPVFGVFRARGHDVDCPALVRHRTPLCLETFARVQAAGVPR